MKCRIYSDPRFPLPLSEQKALKELISKQNLGFLPLALAQASAYIAQSEGRETIVSYLDRYRTYTDEELTKYHLRSDEYPTFPAVPAE